MLFIQLVGKALTSGQQNGKSTVTIQTIVDEFGNDAKRESKTDENRKRERNILSSRKYRAKR